MNRLWIGWKMVPHNTTPSGSTTPQASGQPPRSASYAVVLKTYAWDPFVKRQARRCAATASNGTFFLSVDETRQRFPRIPLPNVVRTSQSAMLALGLANRFESGSLLWWNADYAHYDFFDQHPEFEYYVFLEYDALFTGSLDDLVNQLAATGADLAAFPLPLPKKHWHWTRPHLETYSMEEIEGCLMCISVLSHRGLQTLFRRRIEMSRQHNLGYWPSAEVFLPTEIKRAQQTFVSLENFGDTTHFNWRPPSLEQVALRLPAPAFVHPIYDRRRYVEWAIANGTTLRTLGDPNGPVLSSLAHLPKRSLLPLLATATSQLLWTSAKSRMAS